MVKFIKTGRITILTGGRYAGKKALVVCGEEPVVGWAEISCPM